MSHTRSKTVEPVIAGVDNVLCDEAEIKGAVSFGDSNIVHPKCRIISEGGGAIKIGNNNIFEENVNIINWSPHPMIIGNETLFEVGCLFEGSSVGNGCIIEPKAMVAAGTHIGDNCVVGTRCVTQKDERVPANTVIFGSAHERRTQSKPPQSQITLHARHLDYLKDVLKRFHNQKPTVKPIESS
ncbi:Dynactin subunit 6 [Blyttiomyces sp. JEL0837]|nr:Dynactin subunit 6 [Blyttiomyces sp. JEL0837]